MPVVLVVVAVTALLLLAPAVPSSRVRWRPGLLAPAAAGVAVVAALLLTTGLLDRLAGAGVQGRYVVPAAVGVPVVAAALLDGREREPRVRLLLRVVAVVGAGAQVLWLLVTSRARAVGADGPVLSWVVDAEWAPGAGWPVVVLLTLVGGALLLLRRPGGVGPRRAAERGRRRPPGVAPVTTEVDERRGPPGPGPRDGRWRTARGDPCGRARR